MVATVADDEVAVGKLPSCEAEIESKGWSVSKKTECPRCKYRFYFTVDESHEPVVEFSVINV